LDVFIAYFVHRNKSVLLHVSNIVFVVVLLVFACTTADGNATAAAAAGGNVTAEGDVTIGATATFTGDDNPIPATPRCPMLLLLLL
jgi:hypothetical protein